MYASLTRETIVTREKRIFTIRHLQDEKSTIQRSPTCGHFTTASQRIDSSANCARTRPERGDILRLEKQICRGEYLINGPEFISARLTEWCEKQSIALHWIQPGKPTQNAYIGRFNGSFRRELLDAHLFCSLAHVCQLVDEWMHEITTRSDRTRPCIL
jgi:transposase InsO family protein